MPEPLISDSSDPPFFFFQPRSPFSVPNAASLAKVIILPPFVNAIILPPFLKGGPGGFQSCVLCSVVTDATLPQPLPESREGRLVGAVGVAGFCGGVWILQCRILIYRFRPL